MNAKIRSDSVPTHPPNGAIRIERLPAALRWLLSILSMTFASASRIASQLRRRRETAQSGLPAIEDFREGNERYHWLVTTGRDVLLELGIDGRYTYSSPNAGAIIGYEPAELLGRSVFEDIHPDDAAFAMATLMAVVSTGRTAEITLRYRVKSGEYRWFESYGQTFRKSPLDVRIIAVVRDVTDRRQAEEAARQSEERLLLHVEQTPVAVIGWDADGRLIEWNPAAQQIFGYAREEAVGRDRAALLLPEHGDCRRAWAADRWKGDLKSRHTTLENITKDGRKIICEWIDTPLSTGDGQIVGVTSIVHDVTERVRAQESVRDSEAAIRSLYEVTSSSHTDFQEKVDAVLAMACSFFRLPFGIVGHRKGDEMEIVAALAPDDLIQKGQLHPISTMYSSIVFERGEAMAISHASAQGWSSHPAYKKFRIESFIGAPVTVGGVPYGAIAFASSTSRPAPFTEMDKDYLRLIAQWLGLAIERGNVEAELRYSALHDSLTGLPNQRLLNDRLQMAIAQARRTGKPLAVCFLDLDRFKLVNDTLGHGSGDALLEAVASRLTACLRETDTLARLGGDEFVAVLSQVEDEAAAGKVAERLLEALSQPVVVDGHEFFATASLGISLFPQDGDDAESLIRNADHAMYRAKELGRDSYQMFSASGGPAAARLELDAALRRAIKNNELILHYQPQIDIASGRLVGVEALVRWMHPERGLVPPGDFIPLAEETGLIVPIGAWVLREACSQISNWERLGFGSMRVAVNVSARQFRQRDFVSSVAAVLAEHHLDPSMIDIELTESVTMHAGDAELDSLQRLKFMGIRLSIDDFGTGYASLSNLKRFPIDAVKVDRSFVHDCLNSTDDAAIVKAVVSMGHALHLQVVAEGVETREQLAFLQLLGCDQAQGYFIGRPMPASGIERMVAEQWGIVARAQNTEPAA